MDDVAKPVGLSMRKRGYYIRVVVPKDLVEDFGKNEIVRSLKTRDYDEACRRCHIERVQIDNSFAQKRIEKENLSKLSDYSEYDLRGWVIEWVSKQDQAHDLAMADVERDNDYIYQEKLMTLKEDLGHAEYALLNDHGGGVNYNDKYAQEILKSRNIQFDRKSDNYKMLMRLVAKARVEATQKAIKRYEGQVVPKYIDPEFEPVHKADNTNDTTTKSGITLEALIEEYKRNRKRKIKERTKKSNQKIYDLYIEILGKNKRIRELTRQDFRNLADVVFTLPLNFRDRSSYKEYGFFKAFKIEHQNECEIIATKTGNNYISLINNLMQYAVREDHIDKNLASGLTRQVADKDKKPRLRFTDDQLQKIFSAPLFTGCKDGGEGYNKIGSCIPKDTARFWAPLLALYMGMRMSECLQLEKNDVQVIDNIHVLSINEDGKVFKGHEKSVKNTPSVRIVPIHSELIKLGFLNFVDRCNNSKHQRLFPEVKPYNGDLSHHFSKWFNGDFLESRLDDRIPRLTVFHSFRHNFRAAGYSAEIKNFGVCALGGWSEGNAVHMRYGGDKDLKQLKGYIERIVYPNLNLSHLYEE